MERHEFTSPPGSAEFSEPNPESEFIPSKSEYTPPLQEYTPPLSEYTPPLSEVTPPLPEFPTVPAPAAQGTEKKRRKHFLLVAAAGLFLWTIYGGKSPSVTSPSSALNQPSAAVESTEPDVPQETLASDIESTLPSAPEETEASPATVPAETEPPVAEPACEVLYLAFSSRLEGKVLIENPETVKSLHVEVWETVGDTLVESWDVPRESINSGEFSLPSMDSVDLYLANQQFFDESGFWPQEELRVSLVYQSPEGEKELNINQRAQYEDGWSMNYYPEDIEKTDYTYPGCFALVTYGSMNPVDVLVSDEPSPDAITVKGELGGVPIRAEDCQVTVRETSTRNESTGEDFVTYTTVLTIPRPAELPENTGAIAHFTVTQPIANTSTLWETNVEISY